MRKRIGILSVQGAFAEHESAFREAGADVFEIRELKDIQAPFDGLVLPGGESTTQGKLLKDLGLFEPLKEKIASGLPVFATCAGLILLAERLADDPTVWFGLLPATVRRNAYGRQLGSFHATLQVGDLPDVPLSFIRAPAIESVGPQVEVLATYEGRPVVIRQGALFATTGHPELTPDRRLFAAFLNAR